MVPSSGRLRRKHILPHPWRCPTTLARFIGNYNNEVLALDLEAGTIARGDSRRVVFPSSLLRRSPMARSSLDPAIANSTVSIRKQGKSSGHSPPVEKSTVLRFWRAGSPFSGVAMAASMPSTSAPARKPGATKSGPPSRHRPLLPVTCSLSAPKTGSSMRLRCADHVHDERE